MGLRWFTALKCRQSDDKASTNSQGSHHCCWQLGTGGQEVDWAIRQLAIKGRVTSCLAVKPVIRSSACGRWGKGEASSLGVRHRQSWTLTKCAVTPHFSLLYSYNLKSGLAGIPCWIKKTKMLLAVEKRSVLPIFLTAPVLSQYPSPIIAQVFFLFFFLLFGDYKS